MTSTNYIIQISDTHLFGDKNSKINGSNSYLNLKNVLNQIKNSLTKPELIIVSGDLSQDCTFESYQNLANLLNHSGVKSLLIPGNHDDTEIINKVFEFNWIKDNVDYTFSFNNWMLDFIDTTSYPQDSGTLSDIQLLRFENTLKQNKDKNTIVFMHHHPIKIDSLLMDSMILAHNDALKFNNIIKTHPQVKAVLFGHIHQVFERQINGTFYASAPSTSFQILPHCEKFAVDKLTPGYRIIELKEDKFSSSVVWVE